MSDWQRIIDNCEMAGLKTPEDMFDVSECIDELDNQVRKLKKEIKELNKQTSSIGCFDKDELKTAYRIGFNHGKHCASYQGDDIVNVLIKAREWNNNINWD